MEIVGFAAAIIMGLFLGLMGGGGSILTIPILVYLFSVEPVLATAYSLFVVGIASVAGVYGHFKNGNIHIKTAVLFGVPSVISVFLVRRFFLPAIPEVILEVGSITFSKSLSILILFAILMLAASYSMIRRSSRQSKVAESEPNYLLIIIEGLIVGGITGLLGAGGGFLIVPSLILLAGLSMKQSVGTSLLIIAMNSSFGFVGSLSSGMPIDYRFILYFSAFAVVGILLGSYLTKFISNEKLKPAFGWFVMLMGVYIIIKELLF